MFKELAPLLRHRAVLLIVSQVEEDIFRVNDVVASALDSNAMEARKLAYNSAPVMEAHLNRLDG